MSIFLRLGNAGWYCVAKGSIFLRAFLFLCSSSLRTGSWRSKRWANIRREAPGNSETWRPYQTFKCNIFGSLVLGFYFRRAMIGRNLTGNKIISAWEAAAIWENACRLLLPGASRRMFAQSLLLQEPVRRLPPKQTFLGLSRVPPPRGEKRVRSLRTSVWEATASIASSAHVRRHLHG